MATPLPDPDLENEGPRPNRTLRVLGYALLFAAGGPVLAGLLLALGDDAFIGIAILLTFLGIFVLPLVCLVLSILAYRRGENDVGLGYLLAVFAGPIVGFGTCLASLAFSGSFSGL